MNKTKEQLVAESILGPVTWEDATVGECVCPGQKDHRVNDEEKAVVYINVRTSRTYVGCYHAACRHTRATVNGKLQTVIAKARI